VCRDVGFERIGEHGFETAGPRHDRQVVGAPELLAEELRLAQDQLNAITGEFTADDLLGEIFSRFCIGK